MYYRIAIRRQGDNSGDSPPWKWYSTVLSSLNAVLFFFNYYRVLPLERLRVFSSASREGLREQLLSENNALGSNSTPALQFLRIRSSSVPEGTVEVLAQRTREPASIGSAANRSSNAGGAEGHAPVKKGTSILDRRREETEWGEGSDHDLPYRFTLPDSWPQARAWMRLLASIQRGEIQP